MRILLVRHGESEHTGRGVIADMRGCTGLTARGLAQARTLGEWMVAREATSGVCDVLLSSPVLRARQTAAALAETVSIGSVTEDDGPCEVRPGEADGLTWEEYRARFGTFDLVAEPSRVFSPGGESWRDFTGRVGATMGRLARELDGRTGVATHAGLIVASILVAFDIPSPGTRARLDPHHTSVTEWRVDAGSWQIER